MKKSTRKNGRVYLSIADGYHDPKKGYSRTINIKKIGYLDTFLDQYEGPIAHFEEVVAQMNLEKKASKPQQSYDYDPDETFDGDNSKNLGYAALSYIYHELEIDTFLNSRQRSIGAEYNLNSIMRLLVFSRLLYPGSKKNNFENSYNFV